MAVYLVTGKLGNGKSLVAVGKAVEYAEVGRRVVANFHIDFSPVCRRPGSRLAQASTVVLPSRPRSADLHALGRGGEGEHDAGLLILDECAMFLNARNWQDKDREKVIDWLLHSRKLGWDVMLIVQAQGMLDKQVREAVCEFLVVCRRLDRFKIPFISWIFPVRFPRVHTALVRYGLAQNDIKAETWVYRGNHLFACYSTSQIFEDVTEVNGPYSVLPATLSRFRYETPRGFFAWVSGATRPKVEPVPPAEPHPLVSLLRRLPEDQRLRHWQRLDALGAFRRSWPAGPRMAEYA